MKVSKRCSPPTKVRRKGRKQIGAEDFRPSRRGPSVITRPRGLEQVVRCNLVGNPEGRLRSHGHQAREHARITIFLRCPMRGASTPLEVNELSCQSSFATFSFFLFFATFNLFYDTSYERERKIPARVINPDFLTSFPYWTRLFTRVIIYFLKKYIRECNIT